MSGCSKSPCPRLARRRSLCALSALIACFALLAGSAVGQEMKIRSRQAAPRAAEPQASPAGPASSPRELLELLGVSDWLDRAADGGDFPPAGNELLWRSLYAVRRLPLVDIDRWRRSEKLDDLRASPEKFRGEIITLTGTIVGFTRHEPPAEAAERFDLAAYYRCEIEVGPRRDRAIVYAPRVPERWRADEPLAERVGVEGMFIMLADEDALAAAHPQGKSEKDDARSPGEGEKEDKSPPILVARRVAWYPATPLGGLDMDMGLFDGISTRPALTADDRECFYQLLAAAGRTGTKQLLRAVPKEGRDAKVEPLFNRPQSQRGRLVELTGTARQAIMRRVEDRDIVERFGIDHYFEMQVFTGDSQDNPLTFCVRELPPGFPQGERITESVRIAGFFFKKWGYRSSADPDATKPGMVLRQLAPLLIGREPVWIKPEPADQRFANGVFLVLFVVLTVVLWLVVTRLSRSDARFHQQVARRFSPPPTEPLNAFDVITEGNSGSSETAGTAADAGDGQPVPQTATGEAEDAAALLEVAAAEISKEPFADRYRAWIERRSLTGIGLAALVCAVIAFRLLVWCLRRAGL